MKTSQFLAVLTGSVFLLACAPKLMPTQKGKLYGYTNKKGEWVINKKYTEAYPFSEGKAKVGFEIEKIDSFWNEPMFGNPGYWVVDTFKVIRYSFIDKNDTLLPLQLFAAKNFNEELAAARIKNRWGYINKDGLWAIKPQFASAANFEKGKAKVVSESADGKTWYYKTIDKQGKVLENDETGKRKPDWFDSIPNWNTLLASGSIYVRLNDYESAFNYYEAAARRIDQIEREDTAAYLNLCQEIAYLGAMRIDDETFAKYDGLAIKKVDEVLKANKTERRRSIILDYIAYLNKLSELREVNLQKNEEIETLERIIDVVKRSETEDMKLYWFVEERLEDLKK
ncbi:MAG: WG repeat-containing protein [Bacteroidia bacterium]